MLPFNQECLIVYSRLLLEMHAMFLPGLSYSLFEIAFSNTCYFSPGVSYSLFEIAAKNTMLFFTRKVL